jgi:IS1 transposase
MAVHPSLWLYTEGLMPQDRSLPSTSAAPAFPHGTNRRCLTSDEHNPGKHDTQQIERKHLTLRTWIKRLTRKTRCFSRSIQLDDIVIGLFVNCYEFGLLV